MQHLHDAQASVQPDEIGQLQRTHGNVRAVLHDRVDAVPVTDARLQRNNGLVDVGHQNAVGEEARRIGRERRNLAHALAEFQGSRERRGRRLQACYDLYTLLHGHRVHEVCADHPAAGGEVFGVLARGCGDAGDADRGSVGGEDGVRRADLGELGEDLEFEVEDLGHGLNDHVDIVEVLGLGCGRETGEGGVGIGLSELLLGDVLLEELI